RRERKPAKPGLFERRKTENAQHSTEQRRSPRPPPEPVVEPRCFAHPRSGTPAAASLFLFLAGRINRIAQLAGVRLTDSKACTFYRLHCSNADSICLDIAKRD